MRCESAKCAAHCRTKSQRGVCANSKFGMVISPLSAISTLRSGSERVISHPTRRSYPTRAQMGAVTRDA